MHLIHAKKKPLSSRDINTDPCETMHLRSAAQHMPTAVLCSLASVYVYIVIYVPRRRICPSRVGGQSVPRSRASLSHSSLGSKFVPSGTGAAAMRLSDFKCDLLALDAPYYLLGCVLRNDFIVV